MTSPLNPVTSLAVLCRSAEATFVVRKEGEEAGEGREVEVKVITTRVGESDDGGGGAPRSSTHPSSSCRFSHAPRHHPREPVDCRSQPLAVILSATYLLPAPTQATRPGVLFRHDCAQLTFVKWTCGWSLARDVGAEAHGAEGLVQLRKDCMRVPCAGGGWLEVTELQPPGKKPMRAGDFVNGLKGSVVTVGE